LAKQVQAFKAAYQLRRLDDAAAVRRFRSLRARWPRSPLTQEINLEIIEALVRLNRPAEIKTEASRFLKRHPRSPRAAEFRMLLEAQRGKQ
jgi:outer membrane protein assembly factor BamD (BamD/ComL family)